VPEEIHSIPSSAPVYYATFARVYQATEDEVEVGYTAGYQGSGSGVRIVGAQVPACGVQA